MGKIRRYTAKSFIYVGVSIAFLTLWIGMKIDPDYFAEIHKSAKYLESMIESGREECTHCGQELPDFVESDE